MPVISIQALMQRSYHGHYHYFVNTCSISCASMGARFNWCLSALKASSCLPLRKHHNLQDYCGWDLLKHSVYFCKPTNYQVIIFTLLNCIEYMDLLIFVSLFLYWRTMKQTNRGRVHLSDEAGEQYQKMCWQGNEGGTGQDSESTFCILVCFNYCLIFC